jgi:hypothetical protein
MAATAAQASERKDVTKHATLPLGGVKKGAVAFLSKLRSKNNLISNMDHKSIPEHHVVDDEVLKVAVDDGINEVPASADEREWMCASEIGSCEVSVASGESSPSHKGRGKQSKSLLRTFTLRRRGKKSSRSMISEKSDSSADEEEQTEKVS